MEKRLQRNERAQRVAVYYTERRTRNCLKWQSII